MKNLQSSLSSRTVLANYIIEKYLDSKSLSYLFVGNSGSGKQYTLQQVSKKLEHMENTMVLEFIDDQIICKNHKHKTHKMKIEFNAAFYIGISCSLDEKNNSKINYLISSFKEIHSKNIVLIQPNVEKLPESAKQVIKTLNQNKAFIEKQINKCITTIYSTNDVDNYSFIGTNFSEIFMFKKYTKNALKKYLINELKIPFENISFAEEKFKKLFDISNANLDLVNIIFKDIFEKDISFSESLSEIVNIRIKEIKEKHHNENLTEKDLEDIILSCSLSLDYFNRFQITYTSQKPENKVLEGLFVFNQTNIIDKIDLQNYIFVSDEIKNILSKKMISKNQEQYIRFYNYTTNYKNDSYFERAYYLLRYYGKININVLSLLVLSVSKSFVLEDIWKLERIKELLLEYEVSSEYKAIIYQFIEVCKKVKEQDYMQAIEKAEDINVSLLNKIARVEINRIKFRCFYYANNSFCSSCIKIVNNLIDTVKDELYLNFGETCNLCTNEEYTLKLQVLYDVAPCIIDDYNDYQLFQETYDEIKKIMRKVNYEKVTTKYMEYIFNIFNRKAFLYAHPMSIDTYYDEAKGFFYTNKIYDEYCITLICYAGSLLASSEYCKAIKFCKEAEQIIKSKKVTIPTPEKLTNNLLIAEFLQFEKTTEDIAEIKKYSNKTAKKLFAICKTLDKSASKHVMLTNVASLALYAGNNKLYEIAKQEIENSISCKEISDLSNERINDFYRYHFAWFELYKNIQNSNWDICDTIMRNLDDFIPALFKKSEMLWKKKNFATRKLIENRHIIDAYFFCNSLVDLKKHRGEYNSFCYRGLPVSDLQYTSYD